MAISWTYVRSEFWLLWKVIIPPFFKKDATFCIFPFTSYVALVAMLHGFPRVTTGYHRLPKVTTGYFKKTQFLFIHICLIICRVIRPVIRLVIRPIIFRGIRHVICMVFSANEIRRSLFHKITSRTSIKWSNCVVEIFLKDLYYGNFH